MKKGKDWASDGDTPLIPSVWHLVQRESDATIQNRPLKAKTRTPSRIDFEANSGCSLGVACRSPAIVSVARTYIGAWKLNWRDWDGLSYKTAIISSGRIRTLINDIRG